MTPNRNHPARSHAFLSRLHDGDLAPAERAHFEAHRAHCKECRDAAADFERAMLLFRSSRSSPPPNDLALRVLRKVQAQAHSRRTPFGDLFSVDLRWAGAFAAALLVLLVAAPIVLRQQRTSPAQGPIPVALESRAVPPVDKTEAARSDTGSAGGKTAVAGAVAGRVEESDRFRAQQPQGAQQVPRPAEARKPDPGFFAQSPLQDAKREEREEREKKVSTDEIAAAKPALREKAQAPAPAAAPAPAGEPARASVSSLNRQVAAASAPASAAAPEAQGGEGARDQVLVSGDTPVLDRPARLAVLALDSLGSPPALDAGSQGPGLNDLRGRSYVVVVDGQGRVIDAQEAAAKKLTAAEGQRRSAALAKDKDAAPPLAALKSLRFKPTERQRRLLVRVE